ncbi:lysylphosphatidylglycerol synthase transmembrane domain-containing protein [Pseudomonas duriflava]|nr:YbhN family protein [Pseudomonas duriflava]
MNSHASSKRNVWPIVKKVLTYAFFIAVTVLLVMYARQVDWAQVFRSIRQYGWLTMGMAMGLVIVSYIMYGFYDLIGRAYCQHKLGKRQVMLVSFICYAFTLTLSTWVGGIGMRYRLYSRLGLENSTITKIFSLSLATNWLGYILLAGLIFTAGLVHIPPHWFIGNMTLRLIGAGLLIFIAVYLLFCTFSKRRSWTVKGQNLNLPSLRMACIQLAVSSVNWMAMGAIIYILLGQKIDYVFVLGVLLISSFAGIITHIPAGIGVLEAVFVAFLGHELDHYFIIAALLAYRAIYFIAPLLLAIVVYFWLESRAKKLRHSNQRKMSEKTG